MKWFEARTIDDGFRKQSSEPFFRIGCTDIRCIQQWTQLAANMYIELRKMKLCYDGRAKMKPPSFFGIKLIRSEHGGWDEVTEGTIFIKGAVMELEDRVM